MLGKPKFIQKLSLEWIQFTNSIKNFQKMHVF